MKYLIKITSAETIEAVPEYWKTEDYIFLLEKFNYPDAATASHDTLEELLLMAITDFEPNEAAAILLDYKLSENLNEGQISQISNDMLLDKISEEYPDISLHAPLFHINQLLYKAFNGKFPNTKATQVHLLIEPAKDTATPDLTKEAILLLLGNGLSESNLIKRLFNEQMAGLIPFPEAESIIWNLDKTDSSGYKLLTSHYWLNKEDITSNEFEGEFEKLEEVAESH